MKKEDLAPTICKHGKDNTISTEEATHKIKLEIENQYTVIPIGNETFEKMKKLVKEYRNGKSLEIISQETVDLVDPPLCYGIDSLPSLELLKFNLNTFKGIIGGPGSINSSSVHLVGDTVLNMGGSLPDDTWLWAAGASTYEDLYPELYLQLKNNNFYSLMYGYVFSESLEILTGRNRFVLPVVPNTMIKAKL